MTDLRDALRTRLTDQKLIDLIALAEPEYRGLGMWLSTPDRLDEMRGALINLVAPLADERRETPTTIDKAAIHAAIYDAAEENDKDFDSTLGHMIGKTPVYDLVQAIERVLSTQAHAGTPDHVPDAGKMVAGTPEAGTRRDDSDVPLEMRRLLMDIATSHGSLSYYWLLDIYRKRNRGYLTALRHALIELDVALADAGKET